MIPIFSFGKKNQITPINQTSMYNRKIASIVSKIKKEIEDTIKISKSTLTLTLIDLGYKYKKINLLPFPEGIFWASEPSTGNHM
jgi:hypothetical protein